MKAVILAGGLGTRLSEETETPAEADGRDRRPADPLAHHEDIYAHYGVNDFIICLGYKGYVDQGVFRQLSPSYVRRDFRRASKTDDRLPSQHAPSPGG